MCSNFGKIAKMSTHYFQNLLRLVPANNRSPKVLVYNSYEYQNLNIPSTVEHCMHMVMVDCSLVPRPHPQKEERVWYTSSAFWVLLTWHV